MDLGNCGEADSLYLTAFEKKWTLECCRRTTALCHNHLLLPGTSRSVEGRVTYFPGIPHNNVLSAVKSAGSFGRSVLEIPSDMVHVPPSPSSNKQAEDVFESGVNPEQHTPGWAKSVVVGQVRSG